MKLFAVSTYWHRNENAEQGTGRVQINPNQLGFPLSGMKFDDVSQWVIAYDDKSYTPLQGLPRGIGENGTNVIQLLAELALSLRNEA